MTPDERQLLIDARKMLVVGRSHSVGSSAERYAEWTEHAAHVINRIEACLDEHCTGWDAGTARELIKRVAQRSNTD